MHLIRRIALLLPLLLPALPAAAQLRDEAQSLVDRSTLTLQEMLTEGEPRTRDDTIRMLRRARAVLVCPRVFRAGFFLGGEGGGCALVARDAAGSWSSPAFFGMGSGSIGLQIGVQDAQVLMLIMNDRGLSAMLDSQFKIGADASVAIATIGGGLEGATTAAVGADILAIARTRGLFAGLALEGSLLSTRSDWNTAYYGRPVGPRQIVLAMEAHNPGADPLRSILMRFGAPEVHSPAAVPALPPPVAQQQYGSPPDISAPPSRGRVQSEQLPPMR